MDSGWLSEQMGVGPDDIGPFVGPLSYERRHTRGTLGTTRRRAKEVAMAGNATGDCGAQRPSATPAPDRSVARLPGRPALARRRSCELGDGRGGRGPAGRTPGLPSCRPRRASGLRREDAAALAGHPLDGAPAEGVGALCVVFSGTGAEGNGSSALPPDAQADETRWVWLQEASPLTTSW